MTHHHLNSQMMGCATVHNGTTDKMCDKCDKRDDYPCLPTSTKHPNYMKHF